MIIRKLRQQHLEAVRDHFRRLSMQDLALRFNHTVSPAWVDEKYVGRLGQDGDILLGAMSGTKVVGFCHVALVGEQAEIGISIDPEWRGKGLGNQLIERAKVYATAAGAAKFYIACAPSNSAMIALAAHFGMRLRNFGGDMEGEAPVGTPDVFDLSVAMRDEQVGQVVDVIDQTLYAPIRMAQEVSASVLSAQLEVIQRQSKASLGI